MSEERGVIWSVYTTVTGDSLVTDAAIGDEFLQVSDSFEFEVQGGMLQLGLDTPVNLQYTSHDPDLDRVYLSAPLTVAVPESTPVWVYPISEERRAEIHIDDEGETLHARVPYDMYAQLPVGLRNIGGRREVVGLKTDEGDWVIDDIIGEQAQIDGASIRPDTVIPIGSMSDDIAPEVAPIIASRPFGVGAVEISWLPIVNRDPVRYHVYASVVTPVLAIPANLVGTTTGTKLAVSTLGDNTTRLPYTADTYFAVVPEDADGLGPISNEVLGRPRQATNEEISAEYAYLGDLEATQINAGRMFSDFAELDQITTGPDNPRVTIDDSGIKGTTATGKNRFALPTDENLPAEFRGVGEFDAVDAIKLTLRGPDNEFAKSAKVRMSHAVAAPVAAPSVSVLFPSQAIDHDPNWAEEGYKRFADGTWWSALNAFGDFQIKSRPENPDGSLGAATVKVSDGFTSRGRNMMVHDFVEWGTHILVLVGDAAVQDAWYTNKLSIRRYTKAGLFVRSHEVWVPLSDKKAALASRPGFPDRVLILRAKRDDTVAHRWNVYDYNIPTSGPSSTTASPAPADNPLLAGSAFTPLVSDDHITSFQELPQSTLIGGTGTDTRWIAQRRGHPKFLVFGSGTTRFAAEEWDSPAGTGNVSAWFDGDHWNVASQSQIWHLSKLTWSGYNATQKWWARFSWYDSNAGGTGLHESLVSPAQPFAIKRFSSYRVTTPDIPAPDETAPLDSVTGVRIYLHGNSTAPPAISAFRRGATDLPDGINSALYKTLDTTGDTANLGTPPPFPLSTPFEMFSETGGLLMRGDGTFEAPRAKRFRPPLILLSKAGAQTITASTETTITNWAAETGSNGKDADGVDVLVPNLSTGLVTVNKTGYYRVQIDVDWNQSNTGSRIVLLRSVNGIGRRSEGNGGNGGTASTLFLQTVHITAGDVIRPVAFHSGATPGIKEVYTRMEVEFLYE